MNSIMSERYDTLRGIPLIPNYARGLCLEWVQTSGILS